MSCNPFSPQSSIWTKDYRRRNIAVADKGNPNVQYKAINNGGKECNLFRVDGGLIEAGNKCDFLLLVCRTKAKGDKGKAKFIELKGTDLDHAALQIKTSITQLEGTLIDDYEIFARIVLNKSPTPEHWGTEYKRLLKRLKGNVIHKSRQFEESI
jgi:hypothetical protein